jgi:LPS-assembly lipoprotein
MQRRLILSLAGTGALLTAGCGFRLRGTPNFAFKSIYVNAPQGSGLVDDLRRALTANSALRVITVPQQMLEADVILDVLADRREKTVLGTSSAGQVREFQLRVIFSFRLRTPQDKDLIELAEVQQQRDISYSESAALAKENEEALLYRDMQSDLVQQVMRRLSSVRAF